MESHPTGRNIVLWQREPRQFLFTAAAILFKLKKEVRAISIHQMIKKKYIYIDTSCTRRLKNTL